MVDVLGVKSWVAELFVSVPYHIMFAPTLSQSLRESLNRWTEDHEEPDVFESLLREPHRIVASHLHSVERAVLAAGHSINELVMAVDERPVIHLRGVFATDALPETPLDFVPVPPCRSTAAARAAAVLANAVMGLETVSYGSENDGSLFVNLVGLPGEGRSPKKSRSPMRGHTDAFAFPVRGQVDSEDSNISPSPDVVVLCALRNPDKVPTTVMPLDDILRNMSAEHVQTLKQKRYILQAQATFRKGLDAVFGEPFQRENEAILFDGEVGHWVRFSHTNIDSRSDKGPEREALDAFIHACSKTKKQVVLEPGDLLIVNNRKALHGRGGVGGVVGGESRWLLRTYGLSTKASRQLKRHPEFPYMLYP